MTLFFIFIIKQLSKIPYFFLKLLTPAIYLFNNIFFKYRLKIVLENLRFAFPLKSEVEIQNLSKKFYTYLASLIVEILHFFNASNHFIDKNVKIENPELIDKLILKHKSVIILSSHYNNWEWGAAKVSIHYPYEFIGIYKPLSSRLFNDLIYKSRSRFGTKVLDMYKSVRYIYKNNSKRKIIGIIADQNPTISKSQKWISFFNKKVPVFTGAEKIAKKFDYPVIYGNMKKINNYYSITFEIISLNSKETNDGEITNKYFELLEKQIKLEPSKWLWTHRRWKHQK